MAPLFSTRGWMMQQGPNALKSSGTACWSDSPRGSTECGGLHLCLWEGTERFHGVVHSEQQMLRLLAFDISAMESPPNPHLLSTFGYVCNAKMRLRTRSVEG